MKLAAGFNHRHMAAEYRARIFLTAAEGQRRGAGARSTGRKSALLFFVWVMSGLGGAGRDHRG